jgi:DNA-binding NarL/FixJ family response regulator
LIAEGHTVKDAAALLGIFARTVEFHKYTMMEALGLMSSVELIRFAVKNGVK